MHALQHSGGAAVGCLLNRQVHLLTDSYAFVVHKFKPKDQYRRRLDNKALELAIEPNGVKGRISKVWKTYSMWIAQLENPIDARKVGKIGKIILDGALWTVTPFDLRGLAVFCFTCFGPHMQDKCPTPLRYRCGVCSMDYTAGAHDTRTCEREPKCVYCGKDHVTWLCTSDIRADVNIMRARAEHYRRRLPTWYVDYCDSTGDQPLAPVSKISKKSKKDKETSKPKNARKGKLKQTYLPVDFLLKHQKPSPATDVDASTPPTTSSASTTPSTLPTTSSATDMNAIATFTASAASAETLAPFAPSLEENTNAVATYNALFVASEASSIAVMATQDRPKRAPTLCVPSMNSVVSPGHSTESSTTPPITSSIPTSSPHRPGKRSFAASEPSAATSVLDPSQALAKRPRGRPKGSKEKTTRLEEMEPAPKKRRGRPPGSKNIKNQAKNACSTTRLTPASSKPTSCIAVQKPTIACVALDASKADTAGQSITLPLPTLAEPSSGSVSSGTTHNDNPFGIDLSRNLKQ